jgi:outer membrane murein-binding lipoprotein Lpp
MKAFPYVFGLAVTVLATIALLSAPASGASNWDAMGEIAKLKEQVADLTAKVTALEAQVKAVEDRPIIVKGLFAPQPSSPSMRPPIQITPQADILKIFQRGMFVPAKN